MFRRLWWQHPSLHKTKGPARKPISGTPPPPPSPSAHAIPPSRKAIFGPPNTQHMQIRSEQCSTRCAHLLVSMGHLKGCFRAISANFPGFRPQLRPTLFRAVLCEMGLGKTIASPCTLLCDPNHVGLDVPPFGGPRPKQVTSGYPLSDPCFFPN